MLKIKHGQVTKLWKFHNVYSHSPWTIVPKSLLKWYLNVCWIIGFSFPSIPKDTLTESTISCLLDTWQCWILYSWRPFLASAGRGHTLLSGGNQFKQDPLTRQQWHASLGTSCQFTLGFSWFCLTAKRKATLFESSFREFNSWSDQKRIVP